MHDMFSWIQPKYRHFWCGCKQSGRKANAHGRYRNYCSIHSTLPYSRSASAPFLNLLASISGAAKMMCLSPIRSASSFFPKRVLYNRRQPMLWATTETCASCPPYNTPEFGAHTTPLLPFALPKLCDRKQQAKRPRDTLSSSSLPSHGT